MVSFQRTTMKFDNLDKSAGSNEQEYDLDNFSEHTFTDTGTENDPDPATETVVGQLLTVLEEVGKYDSRLYLLETEADGKVMVWGNGGIDSQIDTAREEKGLTEGDTLGIRQTGETYTNQYGEFAEYRVRFQSR